MAATAREPWKWKPRVEQTPCTAALSTMAAMNSSTRDHGPKDKRHLSQRLLIRNMILGILLAVQSLSPTITTPTRKKLSSSGRKNGVAKKILRRQIPTETATPLPTFLQMPNAAGTSQTFAPQ